MTDAAISEAIKECKYVKFADDDCGYKMERYVNCRVEKEIGDLYDLANYNVLYAGRSRHLPSHINYAAKT